jgi:GTPase SAR1 family protein
MEPEEIKKLPKGYHIMPDGTVMKDSDHEEEKIEEKRSIKLPILPDKAYSFVFIGSTRSGKTTLMKHIVEKYFSNAINVMMTESGQADIYKDFKNVVICPTYMPNIIKDMYRINKGTDNKYRFNTIIDDAVGFRNDKQMTKLLTIYRNSNLSVCLTGQSKALLNATGRTNINFVFLGRLNSDEETKKIIDAYLTSYFSSDLKMVDKIKKYKEMTKNYHFIILDNIEGNIFISKLSL